MEDLQNTRQRCKKDCGDLDTAKVSRREDEYPRLTSSQSCEFQRAITQSLIFGEHHPPAGPHRIQPNLIVLITLKVVIVNLDDETGFDEFGPDRLYSERPV
jgi:hypothetical protein